MKEKLPKDTENLGNEEMEVVGAEESANDNIISKYGKLSVIVLAVVVVLVGVFYYFNYTNEKNLEESATALSRIRPHFDQGEYQKALFGGDSVPLVRGEQVMGLREIADSYGSTPAGKVAALLAGESYLNLKQYSEAKEYFDKATGSKSDMIKKGGYAGLGVCYEYEENLAEAVKQYQKAFEHSLDPGSKARMMYYQALCYERMGETKKAEELLTDIVKDKDYLEFQNVAKTALVRIGTIIE